MVEALFGLGGLLVGAPLGFLGRLYLEKRAERREDLKIARQRREEQAETIDSFLRYVEQFIWASGRLLGGSEAATGTKVSGQGMHDWMGRAYGALTVLRDEIGDSAARADAHRAARAGLGAAKDAFGAVVLSLKTHDQAAFDAANDRAIEAFIDVRRALGVLTRP